ncbi:MAG: hypothetical protein DME86_02110 [Verrucomicrobia bacterium]|nr:MAG: hypothetical protein DME86_02110 [Verrucomicrobiota bacterium]
MFLFSAAAVPIVSAAPIASQIDALRATETIIHDQVNIPQDDIAPVSCNGKVAVDSIGWSLKTVSRAGDLAIFIGITARGSVTTLTDRALGIVHEWVQSESLRRHCYAVADSMRHFAQLQGTDADLWEAVGLLHDMDYERHPNQEQSATEGHPFTAVAWLRENGWNEEICRAILSHADCSGVSRETLLERTLCAVDELSGFVMAVARVRPSKSIHEVDVAAVKKKMKDKAFARAVGREDIVRGAAELGMPLDNVIAGVIAALQADAERLSLAGNVERVADLPADIN